MFAPIPKQPIIKPVKKFRKGWSIVFVVVFFVVVFYSSKIVANI